MRFLALHALQLQARRMAMALPRLGISSKGTGGALRPDLLSRKGKWRARMGPQALSLQTAQLRHG